MAEETKEKYTHPRVPPSPSQNTADRRTARLTKSGKPKNVPGHLSARALRSLIRAMLSHVTRHRLGRAETRRCLTKVEAWKAELYAVELLQKKWKDEGQESKQRES